MTDDGDSSVALCEAITNGTFPRSEELLTSDLSSETLPRLLHQISETRRQISDEINAASKDDSGDVGQWILQARKVQEDIARCKLESKRIVEEHQQVQALRDEATDHQRKVELLEAEIDFTETLRRELQNVSLATLSLRDVEDCLTRQDPCAAASKLQELDNTTASILRSRTATLVRDLKDELRLKTRVQLEAKLYEQVTVRREQQKAIVDVLPAESSATAVGADTIIDALNQLGDSQGSLEPLVDKLRAVVLQPLRQSSRLKMAAYNVSEYSMSIELDRDGAALGLVFNFVLDFIRFLDSSVPKSIQSVVVKSVLPELMTILVNDWLNPGLPTDLFSLDGLDTMQQQVTLTLGELKSRGWQGQTQLEDWKDDIHRAWLNKRKAATLDAVRKAFASSKGVLRQVERVERQVISTAQEPSQTQDDSKDWDASWDEENRDSTTEHDAPKAEDEEEVSAWGFEEDEAETTNDDTQVSQTKGADKGNPTATEEEADDAWGWGDDSPVLKKTELSKEDLSPEVRSKEAIKPAEKAEQEVTLTEVYSISEIPDHIVEIIGRDVSDAQTLQQGTQHNSLDSTAATKGLLALPTLALAMFRAIAPSYYGALPSLSDLHRYNDSQYIAERLHDLQSNKTSNPAVLPPQIDTDIKAMERFARLAYSKEMETQRLIIWDLLEGAQGFVSCTQFPYSQEIENAVSAVVDRIRTLHREWKPVLSTSALMQSIGSLLTMVVGKVISSIEDMDDISEPESQRLTALCQQIASLEDLFLSTPPGANPSHHHPSSSRKEALESEPEHEPVPMTAVYVSNWLRFQYLINILESSLVDIKYLWTEGELSLEFTEDEVVDLIKALFAESNHRRNAIAAIRGSRRSR